MVAIQLTNVSKIYTHYTHGFDRLREILTHRMHHQAFVALQSFDLTIESGQVIGIIGSNGAGKSTLLKLIAGTLQPTTGTCAVYGRVAALLELGSGFHPEMTGKENVYLTGTMMGLSIDDVTVLYEEIVDFSGIREFIDQPVKTYSSGMFVRLAFAVATCVEPDILIVDEALSVGDGAFARKSFNRIMQFKQAKKTILFCSHNLYQVEAICDHALWLEKGQVKLSGLPSQVVSAYNESVGVFCNESPVDTESYHVIQSSNEGSAHMTEIAVSVDGIVGKELDVVSRQSELRITVGFTADPKLPTPSVAAIILSHDGRMLTSAGTVHDQLPIQRDATGYAKVRVQFPQLSFLKGEYFVTVCLLCENAIHIYEQIDNVAKLNVRQIGLEVGVVSLPRYWAQI